MSKTHNTQHAGTHRFGGRGSLSGLVRMRFDAFELDEANARLLRDRHPVALAPTPFAVLCMLVRQPGSLITKNDLLDAVWGHRFVSDSVLKTAISDLRTAFEDDARRPRYIETVSRRGYRFIGCPDRRAGAITCGEPLGGWVAANAIDHRPRARARAASRRVGSRMQREAPVGLGGW